MTVKEAATLKKGDRVWLTRDARTWRVTRVMVFSRQDVTVWVRCKDEEPLRLTGAPALRSLKRASAAGEKEPL